MKKFKSKTGGRHLFAEDLFNLQDYIESLVSMFGDSSTNFVISGCVVENGKMSSGYVWLDNQIRMVEALNSVNGTVYITPKRGEDADGGTTFTVQYKNGTMGEWYTEYAAIATMDMPASGVAHISNKTGAFPRLQQYLENYCIGNSGSQNLNGSLEVSDTLKAGVLWVNDQRTGNAIWKNCDNTITQNSTNLIESGAVFTALSKKVNTADVGTAAAKNMDSSITQNSTNPVASAAIFAALALKENTANLKGGAYKDIDTTPTQNSANIISSGAMFTALNGKSDTTHNHDSVYSKTDHTHSGYAASNHNHDTVYSKTDHTHSGYAASNHNHDSVYSKIGHTHDYAASNHTHSGYATSSHNHDSVYSKLGHTHDYAASNHTHWSFQSVGALANIPSTASLVVATIYSSQSLSLNAVPAAGREVHVIIYNGAGSAITVTLPNGGSYINVTDSAFTINAYGYLEVNAISTGSKIYIRSAD